MKNIKLLILFTFIFGMQYQAFSQCKGFTKRNCLPELAPYVSNGQLIAATMINGQEAEVELSFNKDLNYRLIVCVDSYLEGLSYKLVDSDGHVFTSKTVSNTSSILDFEVSENSNLKLLITTPEKGSSSDIVRSGCVSILVGFKE